MPARPNETLGDETASIKRAAVVVPSDTVDLTTITRGIYLGAAGNVAVIFGEDADSAPVTLVGLAAGIWHPMQVRRVMATNTTSTNVVAGY